MSTLTRSQKRNNRRSRIRTARRTRASDERFIAQCKRRWCIARDDAREMLPELIDAGDRFNVERYAQWLNESHLEIAEESRRPGMFELVEDLIARRKRATWVLIHAIHAQDTFTVWCERQWLDDTHLSYARAHDGMFECVRESLDWWMDL